jgi:nitrogen regulatory protein PII
MSSGTLSRHQPPDGAPATGSRVSLKMVSCIIRPEKLDAIKNRFKLIDLVGGITITSVRGAGHQKERVGHYMGTPYRTRLHDRIRIDIVVTHDEVDEVVRSIGRLTRTRRIGDGKIFVTDVLNARRIRTGEKGAAAL